MTRTTTSNAPGSGTSISSTWKASMGSPSRSWRMTHAAIVSGSSPGSVAPWGTCVTSTATVPAPRSRSGWSRDPTGGGLTSNRAPADVGSVNGEASRLHALVEIARLRSTGDDAELLDRMAEATARALRYRTVVVNLYRPAWDDFEVACVHGSYEARAALLGTSTPRRRWRRFLHPRHLSHGVFHLPCGAIDWDEDGGAYVSKAPAGADPGAWHPEDALFAPMRGAGGAVLGVLSV